MRSRAQIFYILLLLFSLTLNSQNHTVKTISGIFLLEDPAFVWSFINSEDVVLREPIVMEYSNNCQLCYKTIFTLHPNSVLESTGKYRDNYELLYKLATLTSQAERYEAVPQDRYLIDIRGLKYYVLYIEMEVAGIMESTTHIPLYDVQKGKYFPFETCVLEHRIKKVINIKLIKPWDIYFQK